MPTISAGPEIERLIQLLARLPGLGPRSARRAALFLIKKRELLMAPLAAALQTAIEKIAICRICGNIDTQIPVRSAPIQGATISAIVVVADVADLWALERAHAINARYHVLGGIYRRSMASDRTIFRLLRSSSERATQPSRKSFSRLVRLSRARAPLITLPISCTTLMCG